MEYLFVDYENITPKSVSDLQSDQAVWLFTGAKQTKVDLDLVQSMFGRISDARIIRSDGNGRNAVDFHIAFYLGKLSESDRDASFTILSKDKGFDPLIRHLKNNGRACRRIEQLPARNPPGSGSSTNLDAFVAHLKKSDPAKWPKKVSKLKSFMRNWAHNDHGWVEPLVEGLLSGKLIEIDGEKIKYIGIPAKGDGQDVIPHLDFP